MLHYFNNDCVTNQGRRHNFQSGGGGGGGGGGGFATTVREVCENF